MSRTIFIYGSGLHECPWYLFLNVGLGKKKPPLLCQQFIRYNVIVCLQRANNGALSVQNDLTLKQVCKGKALIPTAEFIQVS